MSGRCAVQGAVLRGVEAIPVDVEVVVSNGMPAFNIVGMADAAVQESRERVKTAIKESGFSMPGTRVLVNLAPSSIRKTGSGLDLAIAVGILVATGQVNPEIARDSLFVGELSLDGGIRPVLGMLAYALFARDCGYRLVCSTQPDSLVALDDLNASGLRELRHLRSGEFEPIDEFIAESPRNLLDYADISGNDMAKRALQIAAAGRHGVLMMGPPGSGKTMLASRLPSIMPKLEEGEALHAALIHSIAGEDPTMTLSGYPPFRAPHHSATSAGLIGGGNPVRPGEVSLAHKGVLFLDELAEFKPSVLQQIRQPLEEGCVRITRADGTLAFPAEFMLVAAANPCPCGYFGDADRDCRCSESKVRDYQGRIGGPLMDRIDIHIDVKRVPAGDVIGRSSGLGSEKMKQNVLKAREFSSWRRALEPDIYDDAIASCKLDAHDKDYFQGVANRCHMSGRSIVRTLSIARTIADMAERERVCGTDLQEALQLRLRDGVGT